MIYTEDIPGLPELLEALDDKHPVKVAYLALVDREARKAHDEETAKNEYLCSTAHAFDYLGPFVLIVYRFHVKYDVPCSRVHDTLLYLDGDHCYCERLIDSRGVEVMNSSELYEYSRTANLSQPQR